MTPDISQWQIDVSEKLGRLIQQTADLTDQVRRQNGNVARLWEHMSAVEQHPATCPITDRVSDLERSQAAATAERAAKTAATAPWIRWAERLIFAALGILAALILIHAREIMAKL